MKAVLQRVSHARVWVERELVGEIGPGMLVFLGIVRGDGPAEVERLASRLAHFRCFADEAGRMSRSALELSLAALVVSQFTLAADVRKGRRPAFDEAADPTLAEPLCASFVDALRTLGMPTSTGRFGARMRVELENDGPVTFVFEERPREGVSGAAPTP